MVRDSNGFVIAASAVFKPFNLEVDIAEACALAQGFVWVVDKGFSKVELSTTHWEW